MCYFPFSVSGENLSAQPVAGQINCCNAVMFNPGAYFNFVMHGVNAIVKAAARWRCSYFVLT
ncbi:hypothetical protein LA635_1613 [Erwinia amylovora LA635]|nr:hypothetical protein LA635_1613 [Erwinia amylovora LA635]CDK18604.1 hypothetical protein LA636_1612 [Erwinia amylovora LA636]CDK21973.1 hypothetical protein LA637_1613 [Erwinia amylovora LA637]